MDIQSGYYEAGIVLFWLLFAYLFMDKFLFRGGLGEICFGKMRRRMAKGLRSIAGWFDPTKEEPKKGRRRTKGKTEKKEVPAVAVPEAEERNHPTVKVEMKGKEKEEAKGKNMEKPPQKRPEMDSLVVTKSYGTRQQPPIDAIGSGAIAGKENTSTFADRNEEQCYRRLYKCRLSASRICSGTSVWKSGGLLRPTVPAGLRIIRDRLKTVTTWIPTN